MKARKFENNPSTKGKKNKKKRPLRNISSIIYKHCTSVTFSMIIAVSSVISVFVRFQAFRVQRSEDNLRRWEEARRREREDESRSM